MEDGENKKREITKEKTSGRERERVGLWEGAQLQVCPNNFLCLITTPPLRFLPYFIYPQKSLFFSFFFLESFNLCHPLLIIALYYQTKTPISFWCRRRWNPRYLIQPSETLPVELIETHY